MLLSTLFKMQNFLTLKKLDTTIIRCPSMLFPAYFWRTAKISTLNFLAFSFSYVIWLSRHAGKLNQMLKRDWLPVRARWDYPAHAGFSTVSRKPEKMVFFLQHETKLVQSRWLDIVIAPAFERFEHRHAKRHLD